jgi:hypothetical protein
MAVKEKRASILENKEIVPRWKGIALELAEEQNCAKRVELATELFEALNQEEERQRQPSATSHAAHP